MSSPDELIVVLNAAGLGQKFRSSQNTLTPILKKQLTEICHLRLNSRKLSTLPDLNLTPNLTTLYLYENLLNFLKLQYLRNLENLYIQKNSLCIFPSTLPLRKLRILDISENCLENLDEWTVDKDLQLVLERINLADQKANCPLLISMSWLHPLIDCLIEIDVSGNIIDSLEPLSVLKKLQVLIADRNKVEKIEKVVWWAKSEMCPWPNLTELSLSGNPLSAGLGERRLRDVAIEQFPKIFLVNGVPVMDNERRFLTDRSARKQERAKLWVSLLAE